MDRGITAAKLEGTGDKKIPLRKKLRILAESRHVELAIIVVVLAYVPLVLLQVVVNNFEVSIVWDQAFFFIDNFFLSIFIVEHFVKTYAFGPYQYLYKDRLNAFDFIICVVPYVFMWWQYTEGHFMFPWQVDHSALPLCEEGQNPEKDPCSLEGTDSYIAGTVTSITGFLRLLRVLRLIVVMNKLQKTRQAASLMRKKAKYKRAGSPVERVLDILQKLKRTFDKPDDRDNINFIIDIIVNEQLYTVNMTSGEGTALSAEMNAFLGKQGIQTSAKKDPVKKEPSGKADEADSGQNGAQRASIQQRRASVAVTDEALMWVDRLIDSDEVSNALQNFDRWDFNMFEFDGLTQGKTIVPIVMHLVRKHNLDEHLSINSGNLIRYLQKLQDGYQAVPFHNYQHAADVCQGTHYFLLQEKISVHVQPLDIYCMILAAVMHDYAHPGWNNAFLIASRDECAITYNDISVLESFHVAGAWRLMLIKGQDPYEGFSPEQYAEVRSLAVHTILGTDMKFHFDHLAKFKTRASSGALDVTDIDGKDKKLLLSMALHSADVSNPCKPWHLSMEWSARVMDEFFKQGDREAELGLPISPFMGRADTNIAKCQTGFIKVLILPFFEEWTSWVSEAVYKELVGNINANIKIWEAQGEEVLGDRLPQIKNPPPKKKKVDPAAAPPEPAS